MHYLFNIDLSNTIIKVTMIYAIFVCIRSLDAVFDKVIIFTCLEVNTLICYRAVLFHNRSINQDIAVFLVLYVRVLDSTVCINDELIILAIDFYSCNLILVVISCK